MQPRLFAFAAAFRSAAPAAKGGRPTLQPRISSFVCRSCQRNLSSSPTLRFFGKASKESAKTAEKERKYKSRLLIYDAGDARTTWISFWKAMALLQFGTTLVFGVPPLWNNENQPDPRVRKAQAIMVGILGTIPTLTLAYLTAPFVHQIFLQIPAHAQSSRPALLRFASTLRSNPSSTANVKLEFVTLRIFPFRKHTTAFLHELRALPQRKLRLANIEIPKNEAWVERQREKGIVRRVLEVMGEPRFKFYVKEGRLYTMKTGVPGVWEEVAARIREQTEEEEMKKRIAEGSGGSEVGREMLGRGRGAVKSAKRVVVVPKREVRRLDESVKRQTTRGVRK